MEAWTTPTFNGNRNTMTKMQLKVSTFVTTHVEKVPRLTASPPFLQNSPLLGFPLPFSNFPIPIIYVIALSLAAVDMSYCCGDWVLLEYDGKFFPGEITHEINN